MFASLFRYKAWANAGLLAAIGNVDPGRFPDERRKALRTLNHTCVVDRIFAAHLCGTGHSYAAANTEDTPDLEDLTAMIRESDAWYVDYARGLGAKGVDEKVRFQFTDGQPGEMTRGEILQHLIAHGAYHRGAVGAILSALSIPLPGDTLARHLHEVEPGRRGSVLDLGVLP